MSITADIDQPIDIFEKNFNIPVMSENLYKNFVLNVALDKNLYLFQNWGIFTAIKSSDFNDFVVQKETLLTCISSSKNVNFDTKEHIIDRLNSLERQMGNIFNRRNDAVILIG